MTRQIRKQIVELVLQAARLARSIGISNLLQPGLVKEMILADILGHELITSKRDADAHDPEDRNILYEYLTCKEGGTGQLDRMFKQPQRKGQNRSTEFGAMRKYILPSSTQRSKRRLKSSMN